MNVEKTLQILQIQMCRERSSLQRATVFFGFTHHGTIRPKQDGMVLYGVILNFIYLMIL